MGEFKKIQTEIDEIVRLTYMLGDFCTSKGFTEIVYAKCLDANINIEYMDYANKRVSEVLYELD